MNFKKQQFYLMNNRFRINDEYGSEKSCNTGFE